MYVEDRLPGIGAAIDTDIKARDSVVRLLDALALGCEELEDRFVLFGGQVEIVGYMPPGDDQRVVFGDGEDIPNGNRKVVAGNDPGGFESAKDTRFIHHISLLTLG